MKPSKMAAGERTGRMVNNHGHMEYVYDPDPADEKPQPPVKKPRPDPSAALAGFTPVPVAPRHDGWTADRQRTFLTALAETGSVSMACAQAGVSSRSAYRLRARADAGGFAQAWDLALKLATARLTALAFERATRGTVKEVWKNGELHSTTRAPSDRLLMFLLQHLLPAGRPGDRWTGFEQMATDGRASFPGMLDGLTDNAVEMEPIPNRDFFPQPPGDQDEDV